MNKRDGTAIGDPRTSDTDIRTEPEKVSGVAIARYFFIGCVLALLSDIPSGFGTPYLAAKSFLYLLLIASALLPLRFGLGFLLLIAVVGQDIIQGSTEAEETGAYVMASIWQGRLGPIRPSWAVMLYCFFLLVKSRIYLRDQTVVLAILWFASVPIVTGFIYGGLTSDFAATRVVVDLKFPLMLIASILIYRGYLKDHPDFMYTLLAIFAGAVLARHFVTFILWLNGVGSVHAGVNRASVDSTKFTLALVFLLAVYLVLAKKRFVVGGILGSLSGLLMAVYTTRMLWLTTVLGVFVVLLSMRVSRWIMAVPIVALLAIGSFTLLEQLSPENADLAISKGNRFSQGPTQKNFLEQLDPARYAEIVNVLDTNMNRLALFWGSGYGGYYTESARKFPASMRDAFPEFMLRSGQFFNCHNYVLLMFFKHGAIGLIIISCLWLVPGWRCFKILRRYHPSHFSILCSSMIAFIPTTMLTLYWSGKGDIISGFCIAFYLAFSERYGTPETTVTG